MRVVKEGPPDTQSMRRNLEGVPASRTENHIPPPISQHTLQIIPSYSMFESYCIYHENPK